MSNIQTGAERMPHDLSHLGFLAGQIGRLITISTTPVIAGESFEMDAVGALRLSPLRRGLAIDSTVDIFTFYVLFFFFQAEDGIRDSSVTGVQTCALPISTWLTSRSTPTCSPSAQPLAAPAGLLLPRVERTSGSRLSTLGWSSLTSIG